MTTLYEKDFCAWSFEQAALLKRKDFSHIDLENLIEEIESLGKSEKRTLKSSLMILLMHMLKSTVQAKTKSWERSIKFSREDVNEVLEENPSLRPKIGESISKAYKKSILKAAEETGMDEAQFPAECPWSIEEILDEKQGE